MPIKFYEDQKLFKLDTASSSYIIEIIKENFLVCCYYGAKIPDTNVKRLGFRGGFASFNPTKPSVGI